eukprot:351737-Chlamydomonas_euryale.AAC.12
MRCFLCALVGLLCACPDGVSAQTTRISACAGGLLCACPDGVSAQPTRVSACAYGISLRMSMRGLVAWPPCLMVPLVRNLSATCPVCSATTGVSVEEPVHVASCLF